MKDPCSSVSELLEKYLDQEVTDQEKTLVEAHLVDCSACRNGLKSMEEIGLLMKIPVEEVVQKEDFNRVWLRIKRETQFKERPSGWEVFRSWVDLSHLFRKRVWIPAAAAIILFIFIAVPLLLKKSPSLPGQFGVEYVESTTNNVMVYEIEKSKVTVIWLFEGSEAEPAAS